MSWMEDPRLARRLARSSWVVLVAGFVLLTRERLDPTLEGAALAGLVAVFVVLNGPVGLGLYKTRAQSGSPAWRAVVLGLGFRVIALVAVLAVIGAA